MTQEELEKLQTVLRWADSYFTAYCEFAGVCVYDQNEIDEMDDEEERHEAQDNRRYEDLLFEANKIIEKYRKED